MPWDGTELVVGLLEAVRAARRRGPWPAVQSRVDLTAPVLPAGVLWYLSDRSGFSELYDETGRQRTTLGADAGGPDWAFGQSSYAFIDEDLVAVVVETAGGEELATVSDSYVQRLETSLSALSSLSSANGALIAFAGLGNGAANCSGRDRCARRRRPVCSEQAETSR